MLTEKTVYSTTIAANGEIIMEKFSRFGRMMASLLTEQIKQTICSPPVMTLPCCRVMGQSLPRRCGPKTSSRHTNGHHEEPWEDEVMEEPTNESGQCRKTRKRRGLNSGPSVTGSRIQSSPSAFRLRRSPTIDEPGLT